MLLLAQPLQLIRVLSFFNVAETISSCTVLTQQQRAALRQRIKKSQAAPKP
jgi:hypothetical protein